MRTRENIFELNVVYLRCN